MSTARNISATTGRVLLSTPDCVDRCVQAVRGEAVPRRGGALQQPGQPALGGRHGGALQVPVYTLSVTLYLQTVMILSRFLPQAFADGISAPRISVLGTELPSARLVSVSEL